VVEGKVGRYVGEQGHALDDFGQGRQAAQVAQFDMGHRPLAQAAQRTADGFVVGELALERCLQQFFGERALPGGGQFGDQFRLGIKQVAQVAAMVEGALPAGVEWGVHDDRSVVYPERIECRFSLFVDCSELFPPKAKRFCR